ncbi:MAG: valine--tRNA ligase [Candidatus Lutacidiplasmatales archaeon]
MGIARLLPCSGRAQGFGLLAHPPPPNVTGVLTLGHMLGDTVMDVLARWHRMLGRSTLWAPAVDHAGLSTQVEVRRRLSKQGVNLDALPREEVLGHIQRWKEEHEARIIAQLKAGGFSLDWSRYRYTFDADASRATRKAFVRLYEAGLIYRGERIVNWDPKLRTAVSDLEVLHREEEADLLYVVYPFADGSPGGLTVATVRPETIFGDVAVVVHPDDDRHRHLVGRMLKVPLTDRSVPVISDAGIDPTFGNGALKLTPRHDLLDFEIHRRHADLPMPPTILDDSGRLTGELVPERYRALDRFVARKEVTEALKAEGLVEKSERYRHSVARSERSDAVVEPMLSKQWFVKMTDLAVPAVKAVKDGEIRIHPERWNLTFYRWMESLQDWCISRQVAWGHPIPVYYCGLCHSETASEEEPKLCPSCQSAGLTADPDVLDTWFTSWLWPFAALGWPGRTDDLARYYPTSVLVTGRDIMFFWVARMMMAGFYFTGKKPFSDVYFTGMLRDETGRRMSKHLGNSPDPLVVIRERGADALRFGLLFPNPVDQDGPFGASQLDGARNFLTKLWNVVRFSLANLPEGTEPPGAAPKLSTDSPVENRWILSRYGRALSDVNESLGAFELSKAATTLHGFIWHDLADRYVEVAKEALQGKRGELAERETRAVLLFVLEGSLRMLHPIAPHVTEELWHAMPHRGESLSLAAWPTLSTSLADPESELAMEVVFDAIRVLRNLKAEGKVPASEMPEAFVTPAGLEEGRLIAQERATIVRLARVASLGDLRAGSERPGSCASSVTSRGEFFVRRPESSEGETGALTREREKLSELLAKTRGRLADAGFRARAPPEVVREAEEKERELAERLKRLADHLSPAEAPP